VRLLFVVQRYGREVAGGAELHCREFATRLAQRGHDVEVLTSRARSYVDWADDYPAGTAELDGVTVHRLSVAHPRHDRSFGLLNARAVWGERPVPLHLQEHWIRSSGPLLPDLPPWLAERAGGFDAAVFFSYLYHPTWAGLPVASGLTATVLHPTAHEEPSLRLPLFQTTFRHAGALAFSSDEEKALVRRHFGLPRRSKVIGIGVDLDGADDVDEAAFREAHGLDGRPYLLCLGRIDAAKGSEELFDFFAAYKARNPGPLALAMAGDPARPLPSHPDVIVTGIVDEPMKRSALAGAVALVQPSYFESFSMVLTEAWAQRKAALVQGHCAVLEGQVRRSGGGIPYRGFAEFEAAVNRIVGDPGLAGRLGDAGRRYAEEHYRWETVLETYEGLLRRVTAGSSARATDSPERR
jgi:glycosyltransferase involved in cell wall biosynthesis